ncbi:MAG: hypothetical protein ACHP7J_02050 [Terriglobales bacterium]
MRSFAVFVALLAMLSVSAAKDEFQATDFVKQHLNSIGTEQARAALKNRLVQGALSFQYLNVAGNVPGNLQFVSEGDKFVSVLKLPSTDYHGEQFVSDGKKTAVKQVKPGIYSALGRFVFEHNEVLTEGLWGGTLSTAWALSHLDERRAKLQDQGMKKVDGRELHRVDYMPKKSSDLQIELYFEPDTFRHVMTVYSYHVMARAGGGPMASAGQQERYFRLQERFADFKSVDNLTLPARWTIQFSGDTSGSAGGFNGDANTLVTNATTQRASTTSISQFEATEAKISHNISLDPKNFEVK